MGLGYILKGAYSMRIDPVKLINQSQLIKDYRNQHHSIMKFFDHDPFNYEERVTELNNRSFQREQLAKILMAMNKKWDAPKKSTQMIEQLKDKNSVVVIGGQQAGLLTGPLYTINKVISLIHCARQQQIALNIPVIPVFWIAGEDHDFAEINHIYLQTSGQMTKYQMKQHPQERMPVSDITIDPTRSKEWIDQLFSALPETEHTKGIYQTIVNCLEKSQSYVDFFARFIYTLFPDEGIVLVDSADQSLRELESPYFVNFIEKQPDVSRGVYETSQQLKRAGYPVTADVELDDAHLFYHMNHERILLKRSETGKWEGKQHELSLTTNELLDIARNHPEHLSNNVITRPVMQELLFPTVAFIGGPGEISYWALLKKAFHAFDITMPPVLPRLSMTYIDRHITKMLNKYNVSIGEAINGGLYGDKLNWLASHEDPPIHQLIEETKQAIRQVHRPLREVAFRIRPDIGELADKNLYHLHTNIEFLERKMVQALEEKYEKPMNDFDTLTLVLHPEGGLQERIWNILPLLNKHGEAFIKQLTEQTCAFDNDHYVVYI